MHKLYCIKKIDYFARTDLFSSAELCCVPGDIKALWKTHDYVLHFVQRPFL